MDDNIIQQQINKAEENKNNKKIKNGSIIILITLVIILSVLYFSTSNDIKTIEENMNINITKSMEYSSKLTILQILNSTNNCKIVNLNYGEYSRELADVACFKEILKQYNITGGN